MKQITFSSMLGRKESGVIPKLFVVIYYQFYQLATGGHTQKAQPVQGTGFGDVATSQQL